MAFREPPRKSRGKESVVEPLVLREHSGRSRLLARLVEDLEAERLLPEEHLEDEEPAVQHGAESEQRVRDEQHRFAYIMRAGSPFAPGCRCGTMLGWPTAHEPSAKRSTSARAMTSS